MFTFNIILELCCQSCQIMAFYDFLHIFDFCFIKITISIIIIILQPQTNCNEFFSNILELDITYNYTMDNLKSICVLRLNLHIQLTISMVTKNMNSAKKGGSKKYLRITE